MLTFNPLLFIGDIPTSGDVDHFTTNSHMDNSVLTKTVQNLLKID